MNTILICVFKNIFVLLQVYLDPSLIKDKSLAQVEKQLVKAKVSVDLSIEKTCEL